MEKTDHQDSFSERRKTAPEVTAELSSSCPDTIPGPAPETERNREKPFAAGLCFTKLFWIFIIGCMVGFAAETFYCVFIQHKLEFRAGLLYGPFNPVYGCGAVLITLVLSALPTRKIVWIFLVSMLLGAAFEYICSWFQEAAFGTVSWEYEDTFWNIGGRTNLMFAVCWGFLGTIWMAWLYPFLSKWIEKIPKRAGRILTVALCIFMVFDLSVSAMAAGRHTARREGRPARNGIERLLDQVYPDEVMDKIYPNAVPVAKENKT